MCTLLLIPADLARLDSRLRVFLLGARFLGTTPEFWLSLQMHYDLVVAQDELEARLDSGVEILER